MRSNPKFNEVWFFVTVQGESRQFIASGDSMRQMNLSQHLHPERGPVRSIALSGSDPECSIERRRCDLVRQRVFGRCVKRCVITHRVN